MNRSLYLLFATFLFSVSSLQAFLLGSRIPFRSIMSADKDQTQLHASNSDANPVIKKFCVNVNLYVKPERREEFLKVIAINSAGTLSNEPLNISYTWGESTTEKNTFHFQEQFKGEEGFLAHTNMPHFATWKVFADAEDSPFWKPPVVFFFETL
jgi:(4S)-4-hydroxy-5-phosphonooxypentane-2,3-dione isomerase